MRMASCGGDKFYEESTSEFSASGGFASSMSVTEVSGGTSTLVGEKGSIVGRMATRGEAASWAGAECHGSDGTEITRTRALLSLLAALLWPRRRWLRMEKAVAGRSRGPDTSRARRPAPRAGRPGRRDEDGDNEQRAHVQAREAGER